MRAALRRPDRNRRGVTLVEMLVVVALIVLMMTILVQIFQSATGAMTASRTTQELDAVLRQVDSMLRADLNGITASMTPPNDPTNKSGYFEYNENSPADAQGEDTDDWMGMTTKAPEGQTFSGRQWLASHPNVAFNKAIQPITITSQVAEVIYFLRNGNLYRRVFLVAPDRASSINGSTNFIPSIFGGSPSVSWQGMNDISCRPGGFGSSGVMNPIPNDLGDLTNRENRAFRPRFFDEFKPQNGIPDDNNGDDINDYYPTLYYDGVGNVQKIGNTTIGWAPNQQVHEVAAYPTALQRVEPGTANSRDVYAFPFIYPGMYSVPDPNRSALQGWVHTTTNHSPLDLGDSLPAPLAQTWFGFPTWRETMAGTTSGGGVGWSDPINFIGKSGNTQPLGLNPFDPTKAPSITSATFPPPVYQYGTSTPPFGFDGAGSSSFVTAPTARGSKQSATPNPIWEDDLILTNVRSFDIKAYDTNAPLYNTKANGFFSAGYQDLGYGSTSFINGPGTDANGNQLGSFSTPAVLFQPIGGEPQGFGHEGRVPPLPGDFRFHPRRPALNIGDPHAGVTRLVRTFDTWSTDYTKAPDTDIFLNGYGSSSLPIYPSFPPPYPSPLRGIQIQIRVVDPRNERSKVLTIRQDFTDKL